MADGEAFPAELHLSVRVADYDIPLVETFDGADGDPWDPAIWSINPDPSGMADIQSNQGRMVADDIPDGYAFVQADFTTPVRGHLDAYAEVTIPDVASTDEIQLRVLSVYAAYLNIFPSSGTMGGTIGLGGLGDTLVVADGDTVKMRILVNGYDVEMYAWITGSQPLTPTFTGSFVLYAYLITDQGSLYLGSNDGQPTTVFWDNIEIHSYDLPAVVTGEDNGGGGGGTSEGGMPFFTNQGHRRPSHRVR